MTKITKILTILACTFALSLTIGCGKDGGGEGEGASSDDPAAQVTAIADKACACEDKACAEAARDEFRAFEKAMKGKYEKESDVPEDVAKAWKAADKKGRTCSKELRKKLKKAGGKK